MENWKICIKGICGEWCAKEMQIRSTLILMEIGNSFYAEEDELYQILSKMLYNGEKSGITDGN